jgi:hypothetical protein
MLLSKMSPIDLDLQIDVGAPDFPCVLLLHVMLLGLEMPLVGPTYPCIIVVMSQGFHSSCQLGSCYSLASTAGRAGGVSRRRYTGIVMLCRIRAPHQPTAALASMGQDEEPGGMHTKAPVEAGRVK